MIGFVHINKTAGTTVKQVLRSSLGPHHCDVKTQHADGVCREDDLRFARRVFPGLRSVAGHHLKHPTVHMPGQLRCFTFLRDPVERAASHFQQQSAKGGSRRGRWWKVGGVLEKKLPTSIEEYLETHGNLQVRFIAGGTDVERAKREIEEHYFLVGLMDCFDESMRLLQALCPYPLDLRYRPQRVARDNTVKQRVLDDPGLKKLVAEASAADQELWEWVRDTHYPRLRGQSGIEFDAGYACPEPLSDRPLRYQACRVWNNAIYKQALRARALVRRPS